MEGKKVLEKYCEECTMFWTIREESFMEKDGNVYTVIIVQMCSGTAGKPGDVPRETCPTCEAEK